MRMTWRHVLAVWALVGVSLATPVAMWAQEDELLMPEESAAKAKQLLNQAIDALGGAAYLNVHDTTCTGRIGTFDHSGQLTGFGQFIDYTIPPFKERQENLPKRNIIEVYNGDQGWELDRGGVSNAPQADLAAFQATVRKDLDNILRHRIHEPDMTFRYGGTDVLDGWQADWVELIDGENRTIRIAFQSSTHLPVRKTSDNNDPKTHLRMKEIEYYSNYHPINEIQTAYQVTRERNGVKIFQVFFDKCEYNTNLSDSLFTKESLDQRWSQVGKKEMEKEAKDKKKNSSSSNE